MFYKWHKDNFTISYTLHMRIAYESMYIFRPYPGDGLLLFIVFILFYIFCNHYIA